MVMFVPIFEKKMSLVTFKLNLKTFYDLVMFVDKWTVFYNLVLFIDKFAK